MTVSPRTASFLPRLALAGALAAPLAPVAPAARAASDPPAAAAPAPAPASIAGRVVDDRGAPLADAVVGLPALGRQATTGADGHFELAGVLPGVYLLSVRRAGFAPVARTQIVPPAGELTLALTPSPFAIEAFEVTATRNPEDPRRSPLPTAALSGERLRRDHTNSLAHAIDGLPGLRTLATGGQVGKPVIRGLSGPRVLVLDNGHRLEDESWSDEDGPAYDVRLAERVEVIRGPMSVLYGSDALGGVVNAVPAPLPEAAAGRHVSQLGWEAYGARNNTEIGGALRYQGARGGVGYRVFGVARHASDLNTPAGEIDNTGFSAFNGEAAVGSRGARGDAGLRFVHHGGEYQLLEVDGPPAGGGGGEGGGPERKSDDNRVQFVAHRLAGGLRLEARAQAQRHTLIEVADSAGVPGTESEQFHLVLDTYTFDLLAHHGHGRWSGTVGVSGLAQKNDTRGPEPLVPDARARSGALLAFERWGGGRLSLLAGARVERRHTTADMNADLALADQSRDDTEGAGECGVVWDLAPRLWLAANAGRAFRAPTLFELYTNGPRPGEDRFEIGDPALASEQGTGLDGSLRWHAPRVRAELAAFHHRIARYIYIAPTGAVEAGLPVYRYAQTDARLVGGEFGAEVEVLRAFTVRAQADYVSGQDVTNRRPLPLVPPARIGLEGEWRAGRTPLGRDTRAGLDLEWRLRQGRLGECDTPTDGYALLGLDLGCTRAIGGRDATFSLVARNLADTRYRDFLSRYKAFALDPGRNVVLRVSTGL